MYRQGDILFVPVSVLPQDAKVLPRQNGRIVVAEGEATGHAHAIANPTVTLWEMELNGVRFLDSPDGAVVVHEEHAPVTLPAGTFQVIRQREYAPEAIRTVRD